jgi:hypothetical protein
VTANRGEEFNCASQESKLISFFIKLGDYYLEIRPNDYLRKWSDGQCSLCLNGTSELRWILGMPLFRDYYVVHDYTKKEIGFAPLTGTTKKAPWKYVAKNDNTQVDDFDSFSVVIPGAQTETPIKVPIDPWKITVPVVIGAMGTIVGVMTLIIIFCNKPPKSYYIEETSSRLQAILNLQAQSPQRKAL